MSDDKRGDSGPPKFTTDERELILRQLRAVEKRVGEVAIKNDLRHAEVSKSIDGLREAFTELSGNVTEMLQRDASQSLIVGELKGVVQAMAARTGGQVGGMTGAVTGLDAARTENQHSGAKWAVVTMLIAAVTTGIVQGIIAAVQPPTPIAAPVKH